MKKLFVIAALSASFFAHAQLKVGNNPASINSSSLLELESTDKGLLIPRINTAQMNAIASPVAGLAIFNTDSTSYCFYTGTAWIKMITSLTMTGDNLGNHTATQHINMNGKLLTSNGGSYGLYMGDNGTFIDTAVFGAGSALPVSGAGTRIFWYPKKAAFRGGQVPGTNWDDANIGNRSMAFGWDNRASGLESTSFGSQNISSGQQSITAGYNNSATGFGAASFGLHNNATNTGAVALGYQSNSTSTYAFAGGFQNTSSHVATVALGYQNTASGQYATALGRNNTASGTDATAIGNNVTASGNYSRAIGRHVSTNSMAGSFIFGDSTSTLTTSNDAANQMRMRFKGGYKLYADSASTLGMEIKNNGTASYFTNVAQLYTARSFTDKNYVDSAISSGTSSITESDPQVSSTTTNYVPKWNGTTLTDGIIYDNASNVGIGTASPNALLTVSTPLSTNFNKRASINSTSNFPFFVGETTNNTGVMIGYSGNDIQGRSGANFTTNGHLLLNPFAGHVGIGTASPSDKLHVAGNIRLDAGRMPVYNTGNSVFIGQNAGANDDFSSRRNIGIGTNALAANTTGVGNTAIGMNVLQNNTAGNNTAVGNIAMQAHSTGEDNVAFGEFALAGNTSGANNTALGSVSLAGNLSGSNNVAVGYQAGYSNLGSSNIFVGTHAGYSETGSSKLYIENSNSSSPLIYGDFANDTLRVNGKLQVGSAYTLPTTAGTTGYVLQTNGSGQASWVNATALSITETDPEVSSSSTNYIPKWNGTSLVDGLVYDNGTHIGIGTASPANKLQVVGSIGIDGGKLPFYNTGESVFIGERAGESDDLDDNQNVYVGFAAGRNNATGTLNTYIGNSAGYAAGGQSNTAIGQAALQTNASGSFNTALGRGSLLNATSGNGNTVIGHSAMAYKTSGSNNVALGGNAGENNISGSGNIFLGNYAGANETGNDKLYIENSISSSPLIYGDFANDTLRVNGNLQVGSAYTLPTNAGTTGFVLQTNGSGQANWVNATALSITETDPQVSSASTSYVPVWNGTSLADGTIYDNGSIGIGTPSPNGILHTVATGAKMAAYSGNLLTNTATSATAGIVKAGVEISSTGVWNGVSASNIGLYVSAVTGGTNNYDAIFNGGGSVGIGTASPSNKLQVLGSIGIDGGKLPFYNTGESVCIGQYAGAADDLTLNQNVYVGHQAGQTNTSGTLNTYMGNGAGRLATGLSNTAIGQAALEVNTAGSYNTIVGRGALRSATAGSYNTALGRHALQNKTSGDDNVAIGSGAGENNITGSDNIFIGTYAGYTETGSNKLYIENSSSASPLIYGDFANDTLRVNGKLQVGSAYTLPTNAGTNGFVLQTNGSGQASWVNATALSVTETDPQVSSASSNYVPVWNGTSLADGSIYDNGSIGMGTPSPSGILHTVASSAKTAAYSGNLLTNTATSSTASIAKAGLEVKSTGTWNGTSASNIGLYVSAVTGGTNNYDAIFNGGGSVGIGTATPASVLHTIASGAKTAAYSGNLLTNTATSSTASIAKAGLEVKSTGTWNGTSASNIGLYVSSVAGGTNNYDAIFNGGGSVGIGTAAPSFLLHAYSATASNIISESSTAAAYVGAAAVGGQEAATAYSTYNAGYKTRWMTGKSNGTESGSDVGSDYFINRYSDAGAYVSQPLLIKRSTGFVSINGAATSTLTVNGSVAAAVSVKTANYTLAATDYCLIFSGSTAAQTFTLPTASTCTGRMYLIVNQATVSLTTSPYRTGSGTTATTLAIGANAQIISDGTEWRKIN